MCELCEVHGSVRPKKTWREYPKLVHARVIRNAPGRSWCGTPGKKINVENRTLCGATMTDHDMRLRGGKLSKDESERWLSCIDCRRLLNLEVV